MNLQPFLQRQPGLSARAAAPSPSGCGSAACTCRRPSTLSDDEIAHGRRRDPVALPRPRDMNTYTGLHAALLRPRSTPTSRTRTRRASCDALCARPASAGHACSTSPAAPGATQREFAALGWDVTGVDYQRGAARAARRGERAGRELPAAGHARARRAGGPFDAVTCLFDSIGYPQDDEGVMAALAALRRHLGPGGRSSVEFLHAPALLARRRPAPRAALAAPRRRRARAHLGDDDSTRRAASCTSSSSCSSCAPTARYERWLEPQANRFFIRSRDEAAARARRARAVERFVPAYAGRRRSTTDTFHVLAVAALAT